MVTALTAKSVPAPITAVAHAEADLIRRCGGFPPLSLSPPAPLLLCLTLGRCSAPHRRPPLSTVVTDQVGELHRLHDPETLTNDTEKSHSSSRRLPLAASPSTASVQAPPASPPRPGGPRESVVLSESPSSSPPPLSSSTSPRHYGECITVKPPSIGPSWSKLPPRQHLAPPRRR
jgi:hypothetical protein